VTRHIGSGSSKRVTHLWVASLRVEYAEQIKEYGIIFRIGLFCEYVNLFFFLYLSCHTTHTTRAERRARNSAGAETLAVARRPLNMYVSMSYTGLTRRYTLFIFVWLRHRNTWIPIQHLGYPGYRPLVYQAHNAPLWRAARRRPRLGLTHIYIYLYRLYRCVCVYIHIYIYICNIYIYIYIYIYDFIQFTSLARRAASAASLLAAWMEWTITLIRTIPRLYSRRHNEKPKPVCA